MVAIQGRVDPQPVRPPKLGLLASANNVVNGNDTDVRSDVNVADESDQADLVSDTVTESVAASNVERPARGAPTRWVLGFSYRPEACDASDRIDIHGTAEGTPPATPTSNDSVPALINVVPYMVEGIDRHSTFGTPSEGEYAERAEYAQRQLLACEGKQIEEELWGGALTRAANLGNRYLADANCTLPEGDRLLGYFTALAALEEAIREGSCSQQGMIHARADTISIWSEGNHLRRVGNLILTINDTIVVPGRGYDGSAPRGAAHEDPAHAGAHFSTDSAWAYATTIVDVRRGAFVAPQTALERIDPSTNVLTTYARRPAAATWGCLQVGVHVDHINQHSTTGS